MIASSHAQVLTYSPLDSLDNEYNRHHDSSFGARLEDKLPGAGSLPDVLHNDALLELAQRIRSYQAQMNRAHTTFVEFILLCRDLSISDDLQMSKQRVPGSHEHLV